MSGSKPSTSTRPASPSGCRAAWIRAMTVPSECPTTTYGGGSPAPALGGASAPDPPGGAPGAGGVEVGGGPGRDLDPLAPGKVRERAAVPQPGRRDPAAGQ